MATIKRLLSVHFNTRFFKGVSNEEILKEVFKKVEIESVGSVQMTEKDRIISLKDLKAKEKLITESISLRDRTVQFLDVEKTLQMLLLKMLLMN
jgi:hypothetical protein